MSSRTPYLPPYLAQVFLGTEPPETRILAKAKVCRRRPSGNCPSLRASCLRSWLSTANACRNGRHPNIAISTIHWGTRIATVTGYPVWMAELADRLLIIPILPLGNGLTQMNAAECGSSTRATMMALITSMLPICR